MMDIRTARLAHVSTLFERLSQLIPAEQQAMALVLQTAIAHQMDRLEEEAYRRGAEAGRELAKAEQAVVDAEQEAAKGLEELFQTFAAMPISKHSTKH